MAKIANVQEVSPSALKFYKGNAKIHDEKQVEALIRSIREFGFLTPCLIDRENNLIAGHGRVMAARKMGLKTVPCVLVDGLTDAQRRAYIMADNRLAEMATWDMDLVVSELQDLAFEDFDISLTGFDLSGENGDWFSERERFDDSRQEGNEEYNEFLEKFEIKKTTDDCYTPDIVYDAVADYVSRTYDVDHKKFVRPFYPGGDYENEKYPRGCVVVDNPPFSILSEIVRFYAENGVRFFLFAPTLTLFSSSSSSNATSLPCGVGVTYENGASVNTSFLTNLEDPDIRVKTCPELYQAVKEADDQVRAQMKADLPKYAYPDHVITSAMVAKYSKYGIPFSVTKKESYPIDALDMQKEAGKAIYGKGYLLAERAAAERAAAMQWKLSDREKEIVRSMG